MRKILISVAAILSVSSIIADDNDHSDEINDIYPVCSTCHTPDMAAAFGAPAAHDEEQWAATIEAAKALATDDETVDDIFLNSIKNGKGIMQGIPAICEATFGQECTDEEYLAAIDFMNAPS